MRRLLLIFICVIVLVPPTVTLAVPSGAPLSSEENPDVYSNALTESAFTAEDPDDITLTANDGDWSNEFGLDPAQFGDYRNVSGGGTIATSFAITFPEDVLVYSVDIEVFGDHGQLVPNEAYSLAYSLSGREIDDSSVWGHSDSGITPFPLAETWSPFTFTGSAEQPIRRLVIGFSYSGGKPQHLYLRNVSVDYDWYDDPVLYKPLDSSDRNEQMPWTDSNPTTVWYSNAPGAYVYAPIDGVLEVSELSIGDCPTDRTSPIDHCKAVDDDLIDTSLLLIPLDNALATLGNGWWWGQGEKIYKLTITGDDQTVEMIVRNAPAYVGEGFDQINTIEAGCILGETLQMRAMDPMTIGGFVADVIEGIANLPVLSSIMGDVTTRDDILPTGIAIATVYEDGSKADAFDWFTEEPSSQNACNVPYERRSCIGDSALDDPGQWDTQGGVSFHDNGATLSANASILSARPYNLDPGRAPQMRVNARSTGNSSTITLRIGQTVETFEVGSQSQDYTIAGAPHQANNNGFYDISVQHLSEGSLGSVEIEYICISFTLEPDGEGGYDPLPPPQPDATGCYFDNPTFDDGTGSWSVSGSVTSGDGEIVVPDGQTWAQDVHLYPADGGAQTYTITVTAGLDHYNTYTPDETDTTASQSITYDWNSSGYQPVGSKTFGVIAQNNNLVTYQTTFSVASETNAAMTFKADLANAPSGVNGSLIRSMCIESGDTTDGSDGEDFPGDWDDGQPPEDGPFDESCVIVEKPTSDNPAHWIKYHWDNLNNFFQCELMVLLNSWYDSFMDMFEMVGFFFRWMMVFITEGLEWFSTDMLWWLNGHFYNMTNGQVTTIELYSGDKQCNNLFCAFDSFFGGVENIFGDLADVITVAIEEVLAPLVDLFTSIVGSAVTFLFDLLGRLVDLGFRFIDMLLETFDRALQLFRNVTGLFTNTTPQTIPGMPYCDTNPEGNVICRASWLFEYTFFGGIGALIIPLITGFLAINMILWAVRSFRASVIEAGRLV
jgi:hypothetical protein